MTQNPHTTSFPLTREDLPPSHILQQSESAFEPLGTPQQLTYFIGSSETFVDVEDIGADVMHEEFRLQGKSLSSNVISTHVSLIYSPSVRG